MMSIVKVRPLRDSSSLRWLWVLPFVVLLTLACTSRQHIALGELRARGDDTLTYRKYANASVLITEEPEQSPRRDVSTVEISPSSIVLDRDEKVELSAKAYASDRRLLQDVEFVWAVSDPRAGSIIDRTTFRASSRPGDFEDAVSVTAIQNTSGGIRYASASSKVTIVGEFSASRLTEVVILPRDPTVLSGQIYRLRAVGFDESGLVIPGVSFISESISFPKDSFSIRVTGYRSGPWR